MYVVSPLSYAFGNATDRTWSGEDGADLATLTLSPHDAATADNLPEVTGAGSCDGGDMSCMAYPGELKATDVWEIVTKSIFYIILITVSLVGNTLVIAIVFKNSRMHTTTNYYIVNLAASDLLVTTSCAWVHLVDNLTEGWVLGAFFCKFNSFAQVLSLVSSILTLTAIACNRFFGIVFAMKAHTTERRAWYAVMALWVCAICVSAPILVVRQLHVREWADHLEQWCDDDWTLLSARHSKRLRIGYYTFISVVLYFVPITTMSLAYLLIIWKLRSTRAPGEQLQTDMRMQAKTKRKVIVMLLVILVIFSLCWLPYHISILYAEHRPTNYDSLNNWYFNFQFFSLFLAYSNSAFNPFIYAGFNDRFRKGFRNLLQCPKKRTLYTGIDSDQESFRSSVMVTKM